LGAGEVLLVREPHVAAFLEFRPVRDLGLPHLVDGVAEFHGVRIAVDRNDAPLVAGNSGAAQMRVVLTAVQVGLAPIHARIGSIAWAKEARL
jgi:hypothetical protein